MAARRELTALGQRIAVQQCDRAVFGGGFDREQVHADIVADGGCHNSMRVPSGSMIQPKRPFSSPCTFGSTSTPSARNFVNSESRSSTRKFSMKSFVLGAKYAVSAANGAHRVQPGRFSSSPNIAP